MSKTILISVSINPVSSKDTRGGSVDVRIPLIDPDNGNPRDDGELINAAIARACHKLFGKSTFWWADSGLRGYGQVMRPCKTGGSDAVTYRAAITVSVPELPEEHQAALDAHHKQMREADEEDQREQRRGWDAGYKGEKTSGYTTIAFDRGYRNGMQDAEYEQQQSREEN